MPGTESDSYTREELDKALPNTVARLVIFNADLTTGVDPSLHFTGLPYDDMYRDGERQTQEEALAANKEKFDRWHPQAFLNSAK